MCFFIGGLLFVLLTKLYQDYRKDAFSMLYWAGMSKKKINQITMIEQISFISITYIISWLLSIAIIKALFSLIIQIPVHINWTVSGATLAGLVILAGIYVSLNSNEQP